VRASPQKARAKAPAAKKTKKQQTQFPSTNVPSPVRAPKQKIRSFAYNGEDDDDDDDDDDFDVPRHPTRNKTARGYQADDFVVDDDFAPIRVAKPSRVAKAKSVGAPITADQRTAELTDLQREVLDDFMNGAKTMRKTIQERKGHREAIFTDTVLREMGLDLPMSLDEMKTIPGIRPEMVDLYGKQFLTLINNSREFYGDDIPVPRNPQLRNRRPQQSRIIHEIDDDDEEVDDQNHRLVVDLCSEDEDEDEDEEAVPLAEQSEEESYYGDFGEEDEDDDGAVHTSHHFSQFPNPDVAEFNNRYTQLGGGAAPSTKVAKAPAARGGKASGSGYKKKDSFRKSFGGVKKRASKGGSSRASGGATTASKPSSRGRRGGSGAAAAWNGVMAMPT
jgi:bloom syndrome protein